MLVQSFPNQGRRHGFLAPLASVSRWVSARVPEDGLLASLTALPVADKPNEIPCEGTVTTGIHKFVESFNEVTQGYVNHGTVSDMVGFEIAEVSDQDSVVAAGTAWMMMGAATLLERSLADRLHEQIATRARFSGQVIKVDASVIDATDLLKAVFEVVRSDKNLYVNDPILVVRRETWQFLLSGRPETMFEAEPGRAASISDGNVCIKVILDTGMTPSWRPGLLSDFFIVPMTGGRGYSTYLEYHQYPYETKSLLKKPLSIDRVMSSQPATTDDGKIKWSASKCGLCVSLTAESCIQLKTELPESLVMFNVWYPRDTRVRSVDMASLPGLKVGTLSSIQRLAV